MPDDPAAAVPVGAVKNVSRRPGSQPWPVAERLHRPVFVIFLAWAAVSATVVGLGIKWPSRWEWLEGFLFLFAAATTLFSIGRRLPDQSVLAGGAVVAGSSAIVWGILGLGNRAALPFGGVTAGEGLGPVIVGSLSWPVPALWIAVLLSSRGAARLILRPWRREKRYGLHLLGLASLLAVLVALPLEPFASRVRDYWTWRGRPGSFEWYGVPWVAFLVWAILALGILAFATPWLVPKRSVHGQTDLHPVAVWAVLQAWLAVGNVRAGMWPLGLFSLAAALLVVFLAWRNASRLPPPPPPALLRSHRA